MALVLAVDVSDSIDSDEYRLQVQGIATALRSHEVQQAIMAQPHHRSAIALLLWADAWSRQESSGWHIIDSPASAEAFAALVAAFPRRTNGSTGIGEGVGQAVRLIESLRLTALRKVIDVSGDGIETPRLPQDKVMMLPEARQLAERAGIVINGLALASEVPDLDEWYRENVILGPDAFVVKVKDAHDFTKAFGQKLLRELEVRVASR